MAGYTGIGEEDLDLEQVGDSWLDEEESALESFMQEDALLDAIRNAPELDTSVPDLEEFPAEETGLSSVEGAAMLNAVSAHSSLSAANTANAGIAAATAADAGTPSLSASAEAGADAGSLARSPEHGTEGQQPASVRPAAVARRPKADASTGQTTIASLEIQQPGQPAKAPRTARPSKTLPWRGIALAGLSLMGILTWGPGLWDTPVKGKLIPVAAPEIRTPVASEDLDAADSEGPRANSTAPGATKRGRLDVMRRSSHTAANVTAAAGNASSEGEASPERNNRGRRGRSKGKREALH